MFEEILEQCKAKANRIAGKTSAIGERAIANAQVALLDHKRAQLAQIGELILQQRKFAVNAAKLVVEFVRTLETNAYLYRSVDKLFTQRMSSLEHIKHLAQEIIDS